MWEGEDAGVGLTDPLGISFSYSSFRTRNPISGGMGRFLDNSGIYADDIVEGMMVKVVMVKMMIIMVVIIMMILIIKVRQLRIANFINNVVAKRKRCDISDLGVFSCMQYNPVLESQKVNSLCWLLF